MGRKKKRAASDPYSRIFCYYCDRTFQSEQMLLMHQREKHLRCPTCHKRMLSIPSMTVHSSQMHNVTIAAVPNALRERSDVSVDVLGMKGIPDSYYAALENDAPAKASRATLDQSHPRHSPGASAAYPAGLPGHQHPAMYQYQNGNGAIATPHGAYPQYPYPSYAYPPQAAYLPAMAATPYSQAYAPPQPAYSYLAQPTYQGPQAAGGQHPYDPHVPSAQEVSPSQTAPGPVSAAATATRPGEEKKAEEVKVVFDRTDYSMEELRARLPRYKFS